MRKRAMKMAVTLAVLAAFAAAGGGCASCSRMQKSLQSVMGNGLNREIIVYDAVGNEIFRQTGKFDVEYSTERVLYDDENEHRHTIYFKNGIVIVNEI